MPSGDKVCEKAFEVLLEASWAPPLPGTTYEDRPPSPERLAAAAAAAGKGGAGGAGAGGAGGAAKAAYRCARVCGGGGLLG
jgi:hypothetical protein